MKLTKAQAKALQTVSTSTTVAYLRGSQVSGYSKINGNTETKLKSLGLIRERATGQHVEYMAGRPVEVTVWELTDAGREALGS